MLTRYLRLLLLLTLILALGAFSGMALAQEGEGESEEVEIEVMADDDMAMLSGRIVISFQQREHPDLAGALRRLHRPAPGGRVRR